MKISLKTIVQLFIGILFIVSGILKAIDSGWFAGLISNYGFHWAAYLSPVISGLEIILGFCLILNISIRVTALIVGLMTAFFTFAYFFGFLFKNITDCGCMGTFISIPPIVSIIRNILIIIGCYWLWNISKDENSITPNWKKWAIYIIGGLSFCLSGSTLKESFIEKNKIKVGEQINKTVLQGYDSIISKGLSIVYIFSPNCGHCWNATEIVKSIKKTEGFGNVIGIAFPDADTTFYMKKMKPNYPVFVYPTNELSEVVKEAPVLLVIENGKVKMIFKSENIPCGEILIKLIADENNKQ
jgi:uncharacterized membrane protein YphA (DoxX/SURF4 family)